MTFVIESSVAGKSFCNYCIDFIINHYSNARWHVFLDFQFCGLEI